MRIFFVISVILLHWMTKEQSEATLPGIFLLPFMPLPKTTPKVPLLSTRLPTSRTPQSLLVISTTKGPSLPHQDGQLQDFVKLHKFLEHSQSNFVSNSNAEKTEEHYKTIKLEEGLPIQIQQQHTNQIQQQLPNLQEQYVSTSLVPPPGQFEAHASNQGPLQKSPAYHQPAPLTFPPSESSLDSYRLPRIISLPPLPPSPPQNQPNQHQHQSQHQQQQQQLPQSSSHYTTSSLSYSFAQGYDSQSQSYGPPRSSKIVRHVSVFVAPPESGSGGYQGRQKIRVQGETEKHVNIIFIKSPDSGQGNNNVAEIDLPPSPEQKTYVYVLNKEQNSGQGQQVVVNKPEPPKYNPPDVYFIKYKDGQKEGGQQQQYGPPQQQQPQQSYGAPPQQPPQQSYGPPPQQEQNYAQPPPQQSYGPPQQQQPQQSYGSPSQQQQTYSTPPQQQQYSQSPQPQPSGEYGVAPSNQNFNYTLPLTPSHFSPSISGLVDRKYDENDISNNSFISNASQDTPNSYNQNEVVSADRRAGQETHYHVHNLNYLTSHTYNKDYEKNLTQTSIKISSHNANNIGQAAGERKPNEPGNLQVGLYSMLSNDQQNNELITKSNDSGNSHFHEDGRGKEKVASTVLERTASTFPTATKTSSAYIVPSSTIRPTSLKKYNAIADIIGNTRLVLAENNITSFSSNNQINHRSSNNTNKSINGSSVKELEDSILGGRGDGDDDDNIIILTKRNLTFLTSGDLEKGDAEKEKGSPRNTSGRPDDFRPYHYAPSMDHNYFGVMVYKNVR